MSSGPAGTAAREPGSRLFLLLLALVGIHVIWGVARIPGKVYARRWQDIERYQTVGAARFFLDTEFFRGAEAVLWILQHVPEDHAVLWAGQNRQAMEFVPGLIAPRLLLRAADVAPGARLHRGIPLATGSPDGGEGGVLVLVGHGDRITLEVR